MKILKNVMVVLGVTTCLMVSSCKLPQATTISSKPIPESFGNSIDTTTIANVNWKSFYKDENLVKLIDSALINNYEVLIAMQKIKAAQSDVLFSKGAMLPTVTAGTSAGVRRFGLFTMDGAGNASTDIRPGLVVPANLSDYLVGLQTSWEIDVFGKLKNQKKATIAKVLSSEAMKNVIITNLIAEIANNYYELVAIDQSVSVIEKNINIQENALQMAKVLKETGASNELAIKQFTVQLLNIKAVKTELRQKTTEIENKINFLIGRYPQTIDRDHKFNTANLSTAIKFGVPSSLLQNRPDIKMAEFDVLASKANLKSARAQFYPNLTITGAFGYQAFRTNLLFNPQSVAFNLLGGFTAPLLNRSAIKASFDKANAYQIETLYAYQSTILNACLEVNTEMERINNLKDLLQLKTEETKELNHSINIAADLFKFGKANYLEVLTVQQNALQAELDLIETEKKQFQTTVNIYKALGGGWN